MKTLLLLLSLGLTSFGYAVEIQQIPSPDNANALQIDKSGRRDVIQLRSGVRVSRLFYDDIDSLKPYIAKTYNVPVSKAPTEVEITCNSAVTIGENGTKEFDFTALVLSSGNVENVTITKKETAAPQKKEKTTMTKKKK